MNARIVILVGAVAAIVAYLASQGALDARIIAIVVGGLAVFGCFVAFAGGMRGRTFARYRTRFLALGPGKLTEQPDALHYACTWQGREWQLELLVPVKLGSSATIARADTPRTVARLELARPSPIGLHIVPSGPLLAPCEPLRFAAQPDPADLPHTIRVGATTAVGPELIAAYRRAHDVPIVDLEVFVAPGERTLVCTKLYNARDLPAWLTAIAELADVLDRVSPGAPAPPAEAIA